MERIFKTIEKKAKSLGYNLTELAAAVGMSQAGFYRSLKTNKSLRLSDFLKISEILNIKPEELFKISNEDKDLFDDQIDPKSIDVIELLLESKNIPKSYLYYFANLNINIDIAVAKQRLKYIHIENFCEALNFPMDLFLLEKYKTKFKNINLQDYLQFQNIIKDSNAEQEKSSIIQTQTINLLKKINTIYPKKKAKFGFSDFSYIETLLIPFTNSTSNFKVQILVEASNIPIMIFADWTNCTRRINIAIDDLLEEFTAKEKIIDSKNRKIDILSKFALALITIDGEKFTYETNLLKFNKKKHTDDWLAIEDTISGDKGASNSEIKEFLKYLT